MLFELFMDNFLGIMALYNGRNFRNYVLYNNMWNTIWNTTFQTCQNLFDAFRLSIGEEAWKTLGADRVSRDLLSRAIEFDYYAWRKQYESSQPKEVLENLMLEQLRQEGLSDEEISSVDYYMNWYGSSFDEAKAYVLRQRHE